MVQKPDDLPFNQIFRLDELKTSITIATMCFFALSSTDMSKFGWTPPLRDSEMLHFSVNKQILLAKRRKNSSCTSAIKRELENRIIELEQKKIELKKVENKR